MGNIIRVLIYLGLIGTAVYYRHQHPNRYKDLFSKSSINTSGHVVSLTTGTITGGVKTGYQSGTSGDTSIIEQISAQLSGIANSGIQSTDNPFGSTYIVLGHQGETPNTGAIIADGSICNTPRGRQVVGGHYTLAFKYNHSVDNVCIIEKRICSHGLLGGSYDQHTCYFDQSGGYYEYLGLTGSDSLQLIIKAEQQLGISHQQGSNHTIKGSNYVDDSKGVANYGLIDAKHIPTGKNNQGSSNNTTNQGNPTSSYELGPILPRLPEFKMNQSDSNRINPNHNGVQGIINNQGNRPPINFNTDNARINSTSSIPVNRSCRSPWGTDVFHNQHIIAFESQTVRQGQSCKSELRTCTHGYLRGSYRYETCTIQTSTTDYNRIGNSNRDYRSQVYSYADVVAKSCNVPNYGLVADGNSILMYRENKPSPGIACESTIRTCNNGQLSGPSSYTSLWCNATEIQTPTPPACYDYTNTETLCKGQNGGNVTDACGQVRSCPNYTTQLGRVQFMAREEINGNRMKDSCELYISGISYTLVKCDNDTSLTSPQTTYDHVIENVTPGSYQIVARPSPGAYRDAGYRPQWPDGRSGDPVDQTFRSHCFEVKVGETTHIRAGFKARMSIDDKTHPRRIFDPINGQKEGYENPKCNY